MKQLLTTLIKLYQGQSLARIRMNQTLATFSVQGRVLDVGGGRNPDYFSYLDTSKKISIEAIDGSLSGIDFEKDILPYPDKSIDTVVLCNVLEHIYNYTFLLGETYRVLSSKGSLIGFVPFWVGYHPDPHDYFRYTKEALEKMLESAGYDDIQIIPVGVSPILANFNTLALSMPRLFRPFVYLASLPFENLFSLLRPRVMERHPLGYVFLADRYA